MHLGTFFFLCTAIGLVSSTDDVQELKSLVTSLQSQIQDLTTRMEILEKEKSTDECPCDLTLLEDQIRYNAEDITSTKVEVGVLTTIVQNVEVNMHELKQIVNENENNVIENDYEIQGLNKRLDTFYNDVEGIKINVGILNVNANQSSNAIQQTKGELKMVESQLNETIQFVQDISETIPYTVAFSAYLYNDIGTDRVNVVGNVTYNHLVLNEGESFDISTGYFTVKVPGTYFMAFSFPRATGFYADITIFKNGKADTLVQSYENAGYTNMHWTWMDDLEINDQINLAVTQRECFVTDFQKIFFSGFLIKQK